jgi:hypothetical protein
MFTNVDLNEQKRENVAMLVAIVLRILRIDVKEVNRIFNIIPAVALNMYQKNEWPVVLGKHRQKFDTQPEVQVMRTFLQSTQSWANFGGEFFRITATNDPKCPNGCILAINAEGVKIMDRNTRNILYVFSFENIITFRYDDHEFVMRASNSKTALRFETTQGLVIADVVQSYIQALAQMRAAAAGGSQTAGSAAAQVNLVV